jgi:predicted PurR-regulated permease PerM
MNDSRGNRDRVRTISFYAVLAVGTYLLWLVTAPFILPLCAAAVLVVFFYPLHERWERRFGASPAALASTLVVTTLLIVPTILVLTAFVREASAAVSNVQHAVAAEGVASFGRWWEWLEQRAPLAGRYRVTDLVTDSGRAMAGAAASAAGGTLRNVGAFLFDLIVVIFAMFFLFRDARAIMSAVRRVLPFEEEHRERVIAQAHDLIRASVIASMAVASAQGAAGGLLFWAVGIGAPVFWGVLMAFLSLLPVAGAWLVWLPAAIWFLSTGAIAKGVLLIALGAGVVGLIDNVLRPALLAGRAQMNGLLVLVSLLGGLGAFGLIGIVIGPVIVATMTSLVLAYTTPAPRAVEDDLKLGSG